MSTTTPQSTSATTPPTRQELDALLRTHARLIRHVSRKFTGVLAIDDAQQVARLAIVHALPRFDSSRGRFVSWACYIMRGALSQAVRVERRHEADASVDQPNAEGDPLLDTLRSPDPLPDEYTARREKARRLRSAVDALPEAHRVVMMARFAGKTLEEAGALLSRTKARAQQVQVEAVGMLRATVNDDTPYAQAVHHAHHPTDSPNATPTANLTTNRRIS